MLRISRESRLSVSHRSSWTSTRRNLKHPDLAPSWSSRSRPVHRQQQQVSDRCEPRWFAAIPILFVYPFQITHQNHTSWKGNQLIHLLSFRLSSNCWPTSRRGSFKTMDTWEGRKRRTDRRRTAGLHNTEPVPGLCTRLEPGHTRSLGPGSDRSRLCATASVRSGDPEDRDRPDVLTFDSHPGRPLLFQLHRCRSVSGGDDAAEEVGYRVAVWSHEIESLSISQLVLERRSPSVLPVC